MRITVVATLESCMSVRVAMDGSRDTPGVGPRRGFGPKAVAVSGGGPTLDLSA